MDFKNMTDSELASVMVNYINRVANLRDLIAKYIDGSNRDSITADRIRELYKQLKDELREAANYLDLVRNYNGSLLYMKAFRPSIREAAAYGFTVPVNRTINQSYYGAVADAHYRLRKVYSLQKWQELV